MSKYENLGRRVDQNDPKEMAIAKISDYMQQASVRGINDSELSQMNELKSKVSSGEIEPSEATSIAYEILKNKMDR